jgi:PAS domain S-box-containing protein
MQIRAVICVPLLKQNQLVAAMAVHQATPRVWHAEDVEILLKVANRCWESIERTRVQRELAESEQRLQLAVATGKLGVWDLDLRTQDLTCSDFCKAHFGRGADEPFTAADLWAAVHPDDRGRVHAEMQHAIANRTRFETENRVVWPDGSEHWLSVRGEATYACDGMPVRMVGVYLDITRPKRDAEELEAARQRLEDHARSLEASVAERTAELRETVSELETFSYSISHDLRAPLRAMQSFASILATDFGDQVGVEGGEYIRRIVAAAERMDRLIQDVLVYSRIARNDIPVEAIDLERFVGGILESYPQFSCANAGFELVPPLGRVEANAAALTQCVSNLLGNAIRFVAPGVKPAVRIWTETRGPRVRLHVRDNGIGIDPAVHDKIFSIFYQVDGRRGGTGIGLSVVRKAAERMGGSVGLESIPGKGSTFWLELPAAGS